MQNLLEYLGVVVRRLAGSSGITVVALSALSIGTGIISLAEMDLIPSQSLTRPNASRLFQMDGGPAYDSRSSNGRGESKGALAIIPCDF